MGATPLTILRESEPSVLQVSISAAQPEGKIKETKKEAILAAKFYGLL